jgi:hypothetical protein
MTQARPDQGAADDQSDFFWERLLQAIESGRVVPILGRDVLQVETASGLRRYDLIIAERLAQSLGIDRTGSVEPDLNEVICRAADVRGGTSTRTMTRIINLSLTFDTLLEEAIASVRGDKPAVVSFPAATDYADFDSMLIEDHGSVVFQLLGRASAAAQFAVTEGQTLELLHRMMASSNRPIKLIDRLRNSHLLMIGIGLPDWPARFLLRMARPGPLWNDRDTDEIISESTHEGLPTFLHRFSPEHSLTYRATPLEFTRELHQRWFKRFPDGTRSAAGSVDAFGGEDEFATEDKPADMVGGSVFVSYAREDRDAAFCLADRLNAAEVDVWLDRRLNPGDAYRRIIELNILNSSAFVAVLSEHTNRVEPRWYRREWQLACKQNETYFGTGSNFIYPVIVDGSASRDHSESLGLFGSQSARAERGEPEANLVSALRQAQRAWRKRHATRV